MNTANMSGDILSKIAARDAATPKTTSKKVTMWCVMFDGRMSRHIFTASKAKRIARRFNRLFKTDAAYATTFGKVWV